MKPSEDKDSFWHIAGSEFNFSSNYHTGKWFIYVTEDELDEVWEVVSRAVREEGIAPFAKCSTARPNPRQDSHGSKILCIYVHSYQREEENKRILGKLRDLGIKGKLKFKRDLETFRGKYGKDSFWMYSPKGMEVKRYAWTNKI